MGLDVNAALDAIGVRLATIAGLRVSDHPPDTVVVPAAIVPFPESITYDESYGGGSDSMVVPVTVVVGKLTPRVARDVLGVYLTRSGPSSIKAAVDGNLGGAVADARVARTSHIGGILINGTEYFGATFQVEVFA
jgi:hypothetical protein